MKSYITNTQNVSLIIGASRVRSQDPQATIFLYTGVTGTYFEIDSSLSNSSLTTLLQISESLAETNALTDYLNSVVNFNALPDWSTWSASDAETSITNAIFNGNTQAQEETLVNNLPNSFAGMKQGLIVAVDNIVTIRNILIQMAKAIVYIRDYLIKVRR